MTCTSASSVDRCLGTYTGGKRPILSLVRQARQGTGIGMAMDERKSTELRDLSRGNLWLTGCRMKAGVCVWVGVWCLYRSSEATDDDDDDALDRD